jgi:hypothetical protein
MPFVGAKGGLLAGKGRISYMTRMRAFARDIWTNDAFKALELHYEVNDCYVGASCVVALTSCLSLECLMGVRLSSSYTRLGRLLAKRALLGKQAIMKVSFLSEYSPVILVFHQMPSQEAALGNCALARSRSQSLRHTDASVH